jgi:hypothetical protein
MTNAHRRLERLEATVRPPDEPPVMWLNLRDGLVRCPSTGEVLSVAEFDRKHPDAFRFTLKLSHPRGRIDDDKQEERQAPWRARDAE